MNAIAEGSREQAIGIQEINMAINQLDQGTQHNAAMVEQSTAAGNSLAHEAAALTDLLAQFTLDEDNVIRRKTPAKHKDERVAANKRFDFRPVKPRFSVTTDERAASPARELTKRVANAYQGGPTKITGKSFDRDGAC